jgi:hypothetical protein
MLHSSCGHKTISAKLHPQPAPWGWGYDAAQEATFAARYAHFVTGFIPAEPN